MKTFFSLFTSFIALALLTASNVRAQDEFEKVQVLDHPHYSLNHRVSLGADFEYLPLDAYYKPILVEGNVDYTFNDYFSWEVARFGYSVFNYNTGLRGSINSQLPPGKVLTDNFAMSDFRYRTGSTLFVNLLYSKSNFFNQAIVYHYWQVGAGPIYYDFKHKNQVGVDLDVRVQFFVDNHFLLNIRGGHSIGFKSDAPRNITSLGAGVGFAF